MKNTKHIYTTLWLLLSSMMLSAAEISEQQALEHARQFMLQVTNNSQTASRRTMHHVSMRAHRHYSRQEEWVILSKD